MARTTISPIVAPGAYAGSMTTFALSALSGSTGDDGNKLAVTGAELLVLRNTDGSAHPITITSVDDAKGRREDITQTIPAGGMAVFGPIQLEGWRQSDGTLYLESTATQIQVASIKIPSL